MFLGKHLAGSFDHIGFSAKQNPGRKSLIIQSVRQCAFVRGTIKVHTVPNFKEFII